MPLCQKQSTKDIKRMLASINILPKAEIDLKLVLADVEKAQEQSSLYAPLLKSKPGTRQVFDWPKEAWLEKAAKQVWTRTRLGR